MEWVVTTGRSIDEATEAALDELGVDETELEVEVLEEPRPGLFGRVRGEARVRARVRPTQPRPKVDRRRRSSNRSKAGKSSDRADQRPRGDDDAGASAPPERDVTTTDEDVPVDEVSGDEPTSTLPSDDDASAAAPRPSGGGRRRRGRTKDRAESGPDETGAAVSNVSVQEQVEVMQDFLEGLLDAFDLDGEIETVEVDDETTELHIEGEDLGLLIGPKGQTLSAVQDLARTVAQRQLPGPHDGRVRVDVSGYRERRRAALERFATQVAEDVAESGTRKALEPMNAADRKVVHDVVNTIDGVTTLSEGDEPRRRVVVLPEEG